jgi:glycosyltransferase involved in cell wall biosynthesis
MPEKTNLFIVWNPFQRRSETLASIFDLDARYFHFKWEEKGKLFKAISYIPKFFFTIWVLIKNRPENVFLQLAPTPLLYTAALYKLVFGGRMVADCHNTMIYDDHWIRWPFAKRLLRHADITLVHNDDVQKIARDLGIETLILRDPLPVIKVPANIEEVAGISVKNQAYVIIPCGIAADEPIRDLFEAIGAVPDTLFVMTWFAEKLPADLRAQSPQNLRFTGFLPEPEFNALFANAKAALVLTTREGTQPSGAAEAISLGIPLIVSELVTTKRLYNEAPVFVQNNVDSVAAGICKALQNYDDLSEAIAGLRQCLIDDANTQIDHVRTMLTKQA